MDCNAPVPISPHQFHLQEKALLQQHPVACHFGDQGAATLFVGHGGVPQGWHAGHHEAYSKCFCKVAMGLAVAVWLHCMQALPLLHEPGEARTSDPDERNVLLAQGDARHCLLLCIAVLPRLCDCDMLQRSWQQTPGSLQLTPVQQQIRVRFGKGKSLQQISTHPEPHFHLAVVPVILQGLGVVYWPSCLVPIYSDFLPLVLLRCNEKVCIPTGGVTLQI